MEEIDLCWRVKILGYKICTVPQSRMYHLGGATLSATEPRKTYLNFRNNLLMLYKNLPRREGRWLLLIRRLLDTVALARYMAAESGSTPRPCGSPTATSAKSASAITSNRPSTC